MVEISSPILSPVSPANSTSSSSSSQLRCSNGSPSSSSVASASSRGSRRSVDMVAPPAPVVVTPKVEQVTNDNNNDNDDVIELSSDQILKQNKNNAQAQFHQCHVHHPNPQRMIWKWLKRWGECRGSFSLNWTGWRSETLIFYTSPVSFFTFDKIFRAN